MLSSLSLTSISAFAADPVTVNGGKVHLVRWNDANRWLSRFEIACVQRDADKNLSLKNSRLERLILSSEQKDKLVIVPGLPALLNQR